MFMYIAEVYGKIKPGISPKNESTPAIFQKLEALLKAGKWRDADVETSNLMLR